MTRRPKADGHVITPLTSAKAGTSVRTKAVDSETGEIVEVDRPVRYDPDAKLHTTGDKRQVVGNKFWHASLRGTQPHQRVILAVDAVPDVKGEKNSENHIMMRNFGHLARFESLGIVGPVVDGVARGVDIDKMQADYGWIPVIPLAAAAVDKKSGERTEKEGFYRRVDVDGCDAGAIDVHYYAGRLVKAEVTDTGTTTFADLTWKKAIRRPNKNGTWRIYVEYELTCNCGQHTTVLRESTITSDEDRERGFNRAENLRAVPPGVPGYADIYPNRSSIEGDNRRIDDNLHLRRARSYGIHRQLADLIAHQHLINSVARHLFGANQQPQRADTQTPAAA